MAEIIDRPVGKKKHGTSSSKKSTRVDLTPMVDLGFILITFFVFTAALSQPMAMNLKVPNDKDSTVSDNICESCVLTILLGEKNSIWYYEGKEKYSQEKLTDYTSKGIRKLILEKKREVLAKRGKNSFVLIIKPTPRSSFKNMVDIVDECSINRVTKYYIDEINDEDRNWLKHKSSFIIEK